MALTAVTSIVLFAVILAVTNGQRISMGACPDIPPQKGYNVTQNMGTWYEVQAYPAVFQYWSKCPEATLELQANGHVLIKGQSTNIFTGMTTEVNGDAAPTDANVPGTFDVGLYAWLPSSEFTVVLTNYKTYTVTYSCTDIYGWTKMELAFIHSRERTLDDDTLMSVMDQLAAIGIEPNAFVAVDQTDC